MIINTSIPEIQIGSSWGTPWVSLRALIILDFRGFIQWIFVTIP